MNRFNLRVYGIIINENDEVLVSDERRFGNFFTKFPGGGLEWGEGTKECLIRELEEELGLTTEVGELFYVNDFFQASAFKKEDQLFSFYFFVDRISLSDVPTSKHSFPLSEDGEQFRWVKISRITSSSFSFPIDKVVGEKLKKNFNND